MIYHHKHHYIPNIKVLIINNQAKHFVPWTEYPQPMFPDYCSGVFYIMSGKVKTNYDLTTSSNGVKLFSFALNIARAFYEQEEDFLLTTHQQF